MQALDFSLMPAPKAIEALDYENILSKLLDAARSIEGWDAELESDSVLKLLEITAYRELILRDRINQAIKATTLASAIDSDLDYLAANNDLKRLDNEDDSAFRHRTQQSFNRIAVAGPSDYYKQLALGFNKEILDVNVYSEAAGEVIVCVLARAEALKTNLDPDTQNIGQILFGEHQDQKKSYYLLRNHDELMNQLREYLNKDDVRPLTDSVQVRAPSLKHSEIIADLTTYPGPDPIVLQANAQQQLQAYLLYTRKMAYDKTKAGIIAALNVPGVQNTVLISPLSDITCNKGELIIIDRTTLNYRGTMQ